MDRAEEQRLNIARTIKFQRGNERAENISMVDCRRGKEAFKFLETRFVPRIVRKGF